jgi:hypothetical protein
MTTLSTSFAPKAILAAQPAMGVVWSAAKWSIVPFGGCPAYLAEGLRAQELGNIRDHGPPGHLNV